MRTSAVIGVARRHSIWERRHSRDIVNSLVPPLSPESLRVHTTITIRGPGCRVTIVPLKSLIVSSNVNILAADSAFVLVQVLF